jgi:cytochrome c oxidase subunit II
MIWSLPQASENAAEVDYLLWALLAISLAVLSLVLALLLRFVIKYRASSRFDRGALDQKSWRFEIAWTAATLVVFLALFVWGASLYLRLSDPPRDALQIYVIGKQWMWKVEHIGGQREIDAVHVPVGRAIQLVMTSEDVIHDFSVPAFRIKHDVLPGRYESLWFTPSRIGTYHLYCTQFCGLDHAKMGGEVVVMSPPDFERWLAQNGGAGDLADEGRGVFVRFGCGGCHASSAGDTHGTVHAPVLAGLYGARVPLSDGRVVAADERYLHDSIVDPGRDLVAGYDPIMPSFAGQISEEDIVKLVAYIKSLAPDASP